MLAGSETTILQPAPLPGTGPLPSEASLREHAVRSMAPMLCGDLTQFVCAMFEQPHLVRAYFRPTTLLALDSGIDRPRAVLPFEVALSGAKRAWAMPLLLRHERAVASVAALAYPCANFLAADPSSR